MFTSLELPVPQLRRDKLGGVQKVEDFVDHLLTENEKYNLTAVRNKEDAYTRYASTAARVLTGMACPHRRQQGGVA